MISAITPNDIGFQNSKCEDMAHYEGLIVPEMAIETRETSGYVLIIVVATGLCDSQNKQACCSKALQVAACKASHG